MEEVNNIKQMQSVTPITKLKEYSEGKIVELPQFGPDERFFAKLKRPSLLALAKTGQIPNTLLESANMLFFGNDNSKKKLSSDALKETMGVVEILCKAAFVEPSYDEIKEAEIELTDEQLMFVFTYAQKGVEALKPFRGQQGDSADNTNAQDVQDQAI